MTATPTSSKNPLPPFFLTFFSLSGLGGGGGSAVATYVINVILFPVPSLSLFLLSEHQFCKKKTATSREREREIEKWERDWRDVAYKDGRRRVHAESVALTTQIASQSHHHRQINRLFFLQEEFVIFSRYIRVKDHSCRRCPRNARDWSLPRTKHPRSAIAVNSTLQSSQDRFEKFFTYLRS